MLDDGVYYGVYCIRVSESDKIMRAYNYLKRSVKMVMLPLNATVI